jgi:hypothetical protein
MPVNPGSTSQADLRGGHAFADHLDDAVRWSA